MLETDLPRLEERLGYAFVDRDLLRLALTHTTWVEENARGENARARASQQRLEFLGDALLGYAIARWLFELLPDSDEGDLSERRTHFARASWLHAKGAELGLREFVRFGRGGDADADRNDRLLADTTEALIGAVALDRGDAAAIALIRSWLPSEPPAAPRIDPIIALGEWHQKRYNAPPPEPAYSEREPQGLGSWVAASDVDGKIGHGRGRKKKDAKREAFRAILAQIDPKDL